MNTVKAKTKTKTKTFLLTSFLKKADIYMPVQKIDTLISKIYVRFDGQALCGHTCVLCRAFAGRVLQFFFSLFRLIFLTALPFPYVGAFFSL